ncbi:MAG: winged helix-turn-helix domain-containing protein, partial [Bryobacterales bacterium]|nr:winged helix-turn-helix domain-containing protein [Bryobacterales bacterium]
LTLDTLKGTLTAGGEIIHLRPKTFLLFQYLVENHHRLVSKEELFEQIWKDAHVTDSTLVGCIQEIRKAIEDDVRTPRFIKTVPRRGYQFIAPLDGPQPEPVPQAATPIPPPSRPRRLLPLALAAACIAGGAVWLSARKNLVIQEPPRFEVAWWKLDQGPAPVSGVIGNAAHFDGQRTVVEGVDHEGAFPVGAAPRTMMAWIQTTTTNGDSTVLFNYNTAPRLDDSQDSFRLSLRQDGRIAWSRHGWAGQAGRSDLAVSSLRVDDGRWHLIAGSYAGAPSHQGILYIDGVEQASASMPAPAAEQPGPETRWALGNGVRRGTYFRGAIDDARIYAYAVRPAIVAALYRCGAALEDLQVPGQGSFYYMPLASPGPHEPVHLDLQPQPASLIRHTGLDYAGVQLGRRAGQCAMAEMRPADLGQDVYISVDLLTPVDNHGRQTQAGPFLRSRRAAPGDGIQGGSSAGFWVRLHSSGIVTVRRLNPMSTIAFTAPAPGFDPSKFHKLEIAAKGATLQAALDGRLLSFEQAGKTVRHVVIEPAWESASPPGENRGSVGIYFSAEEHRGLAGGQQARNWIVLPQSPSNFP